MSTPVNPNPNPIFVLVLASTAARGGLEVKSWDLNANERLRILYPTIYRSNSDLYRVTTDYTSRPDQMELEHGVRAVLIQGCLIAWLRFRDPSRTCTWTASRSHSYYIWYIVVVSGFYPLGRKRTWKKQGYLGNSYMKATESFQATRCK